jgi:hypothetical protein
MWVRSLVFCLSWVVIAAVGEADEDRAASTTLRLWVEYYQEVASGYDIRLQSAPDERLAVSAKPVLVYSNPTIGYDTHGAIFVWTRNGRAEAIAAIWSKRIGADSKSLKNVNHEFHSLANEPLTARGTDGVVWSPSKPGLDFRLIPDAPEPAESRAGRLAQMRQISRDFTGFDLNPREEGSTEEVERELRVLAKPLYRYEEIDRKSDKDARTNAFEDGAVFGLFLDWDPEILLVLETRPTASGPRWHYAVAHVDYKPLRLQYQSRDVWSKPEKNFGRPDHKYYCVIGVAKRPVELE